MSIAAKNGQEARPMNTEGNDPTQGLSRLHITVHGRVQGVGFRAFVQQVGVRLGLTGWVRNMGYDQVECLAEGRRALLEQFAQAVADGPIGSRVEECQQEWGTYTGEFDRFFVRGSR